MGARAVWLPIYISMLMILALAPPIVGHSMTFGGNPFGSVCVDPNSSKLWTVFSNSGPADKTWFFRVRLGLDGGDADQWARWDVSLIDHAIFAEVANWRGAAFEWVKTGVYVFADTLSAHLGGGVTMYYTIYNDDPQSQCYMVWVRGAYM